MSTPRNDDDTPRPDPKKGPVEKEGSDPKENANAEGSDAEKGYKRRPLTG